MNELIKVFLAYSREDTKYLDELRKHFAPLERSGKVSIWYDGKIEPGAIWDREIKERLHDADIVLLLVSASAIASDYFYEQEMKDALERHKLGKTKVVPFILRPCAWRATPLADIQVIPKDAKAATTWTDRDEAYSDAVNQLWEMVINIENNRINQVEIERKEREVERIAQEQAELKRKREDERKAKEKAELKHKQEEERKDKEEAELKRKQEEDRKTKEETEFKIKRENETKVKEIKEGSAAKDQPKDKRKKNIKYYTLITAPIIFLLFIFIFFIWLPKFRENKSFERAQVFNTIYHYEKYLKDFPNGRHARYAEDKIAEITFNTCYTKEEYIDFLSNYPNSLFSRNAKDKIHGLEMVETGYFIDQRDQRKYKVVMIRKQIWMAQNLAANKFTDGTEIPLVTDGTAWGKLTTPGYCWYDNINSWENTFFGALYNYYAVESGILCPLGWHVPSKEEWNNLFNKLGGANNAGGQLKERGTKIWNSPNQGATNITGFSALPGGYRSHTGDYFGSMGYSGYWWSASGYYKAFIHLNYLNDSVEILNPYLNSGFSVRCVLDE